MYPYSDPAVGQIRYKRTEDVMNFQNLEYFRAVARERNITKAAEQLGITQQALSNQIGRLEQELGCRLFDRSRGFELTPSGRYFLDSAERILDISHQTETVINDINANNRGELKIGISFSRGQAILPLLLPAFTRKFPKVMLSITEGSTRELESLLARGSIDIMIGYTPFMLETSESVDLFSEDIYLVAPVSLLSEKFGSSWEKIVSGYRKKPDLKIFADMPFVLLKKGDRIRTMVDQECFNSGFTPRIITETENIQTAFALAAEGMGFSVCPRLYLDSPYTIAGSIDSEIRKKVVLLSFSDRRFDTIAVGYNSERYLSNIARDFIDMSVEMYKSRASQDGGRNKPS